VPIDTPRPLPARASITTSRSGLLLLAAVACASCKLRSRGETSDASVTSSSSPDTKLLDEPTFSVRYPSTWGLKRDEGSIDLEHPSNYCYVRIVPRSLATLETHVKMQTEKTYDGVVAKQTPLTSWGPLSGAGMELRGKKKGKTAGFTRLFRAEHGGSALLVVESCFEDSERETQPAFDAIRRSFAWK
jgi:hypothetical protein